MKFLRWCKTVSILQELFFFLTNIIQKYDIFEGNVKEPNVKPEACMKTRRATRRKKKRLKMVSLNFSFWPPHSEGAIWQWIAADATRPPPHLVCYLNTFKTCSIWFFACFAFLTRIQNMTSGLKAGQRTLPWAQSPARGSSPLILNITLTLETHHIFPFQLESTKTVESVRYDEVFWTSGPLMSSVTLILNMLQSEFSVCLFQLELKDNAGPKARWITFLWV